MRVLSASAEQVQWQAHDIGMLVTAPLTTCELAALAGQCSRLDTRHMRVACCM